MPLERNAEIRESRICRATTEGAFRWAQVSCKTARASELKVSVHVCVTIARYVHVCMYERRQECMYACMYVCMYVCVHVRMYACMYLCMCMCSVVQMYSCMYICIYSCNICMYLVCTLNLSVYFLCIQIERYNIDRYRHS